MAAPRVLPLVIVACDCGEYVVSELHPVPPCQGCQLIPQYVRDTTWWLEL